ncbi:MAG: hypothetical protein RLZZ488_1707 [Pseudomonadota bacterium]
MKFSGAHTQQQIQFIEDRNMGLVRRWNLGCSNHPLRALCSLLVVCGGGLGLSSEALAVTAQVSGEAAVVGEFLSSMPPKSAEFKGLRRGVRVPLGLRLEGRASSNVSVFLDLRYNANQYPEVAFPLGNMEDTSAGAKTTGNDVNHPFSKFGGRGEKREWLKVNQAFVQYDSGDAGRFRAGRIPRNWGLGIWLDDEWKPEGGTRSTSDAISYTLDFPSELLATVYWEKISEGSLSSDTDDADALTGEIVIGDRGTDGSSSGLSRKLGLAFSKYDHKDSSTELKILDIFGVFSLGRAGFEAELNWPTGKSRSLNYASAGGEAVNPDGSALSRDSQSVEGLNILMRARYQLGGGVSAPDRNIKISQTDATRQRIPTSQAGESQILGLTAGYSRGDADAFDNVKNKDTKVTGIPMHPNVRPAFLMFNPLSADKAGMPGAIVRNVLFARAEYSYESAGVGMLTPAVIFARLDQTNTKASAADTNVGGNSNLGFEFDLNYSYRTVDGLRISLDGGLWVPGGAWETSGVKPETVYGIRATAATFF